MGIELLHMRLASRSGISRKREQPNSVTALTTVIHTGKDRLKVTVSDGRPTKKRSALPNALLLTCHL
jgi:hypothetical protein